MPEPEPEYHDLHVNKSAAETIQACAEHAAVVHDFWVSAAADVRRSAGRQPEYARLDDKTLPSWSRQISLLFNTFFGSESRVTKDGPLSLYVSTTTGFEYGLIFHPTHYRVDKPEPEDLKATATTALMGRYCFHDGQNCFKPVRGGECEVHGPVNVALALPIPGEWSFHS